MLGRVIRGEVLSLAPREMEAFINRAATENLCLSVTTTKQTNFNPDFEYSLPIPSRESVRELIIKELSLSLPHELAGKVELLVENLDDWGFLAKPIDQLSLELGIATTEIGTMIAHLGSIAPGGIGSANLASYLLWQVNQLPDSPPVILARRLIEDCFDLLVKLKLPLAARKLTCSVSEIISVYRGIILPLKPYPLALSDQRTEIADPCAAFRVGATGKLSWEHCADQSLRLSVLPPAAFMEGIQKLDAAGFLAALRRDNTWAHKLAQAIEERQNVLVSVLDHLLERESQFVLGNTQFPLGCSQSNCCEDLQLSPSSLSRFVNANSVILPSGKILWLRRFFEPQGKLRNALWEELSDNHPHSSYSDNELAERLAARGLAVSRRTVTKYREKLGFENSYIRRRRAELDEIPDMQEEG